MTTSDPFLTVAGGALQLVLMGANVDKTEADIQVVNTGSICMLRPCNEVGRTWLRDNLDPEAAWQADGSVAVEPRYVFDIVDGALRDGLAVAVP